MSNYFAYFFKSFTRNCMNRKFDYIIINANLLPGNDFLPRSHQLTFCEPNGHWPKDEHNYLTKKLMVDHPPSRKHLLSTCPHIVPSIVSVSHVTRVTLRDMMCPRDSVTTFCLTWLHIWGLYSYKPSRQNISLAISSVLAIMWDHNTSGTCLFKFTVQKCLHSLTYHNTELSLSVDTCWGKPAWCQWLLRNATFIPSPTSQRFLNPQSDWSLLSPLFAQ